MEETLNRASTPSSSPKLQLKQFNPIELSTYDCGMLLLCYFIKRKEELKVKTRLCLAH